MVELSQTYVAEKGGSAELYQKAYKDHYSVTFAPVEGQLQTSVMAIFGFVKSAASSQAPRPGRRFCEMVKRLALQALAIATFIVLWWVAAAYASSQLLPTPGQTLSEFIHIMSSSKGGKASATRLSACWRAL